MLGDFIEWLVKKSEIINLKNFLVFGCQYFNFVLGWYDLEEIFGILVFILSVGFYIRLMLRSNVSMMVE